MLETEDGNATYDLAIMEEIFIAAETAKSSFEKSFTVSHAELKKIFNNMKADNGFKGETKEGFMEIFEILLTFQENLIEEMPKLYETFATFKEELEKIKTLHFYTELEV